jgi:Ca2+-binding EF-hand superfamily protein
LSYKSDFNLYDAFNIFDSGRVGNITIHDIREGLNQIGVYPTAEEVELFMTRYDRTKDRRLTFSEFSDAFLPLDPQQASILNRRRANPVNRAMYRRDDCFLADTQIEFRSMWRVHLKIECANETLRQRLQSRPLFNVAEAFNSLDINADGRISIDEVKRLIESRGYFVSP